MFDSLEVEIRDQGLRSRMGIENRSKKKKWELRIEIRRGYMKRSRGKK